MNCHHFIMGALQLDIASENTSDYLNDTKFTDLRYLVNAKSNQQFNLDKYTQVFNQQHGFISNLSILDLLFMEGPNALNYLEQQKLSF